MKMGKATIVRSIGVVEDSAAMSRYDELLAQAERFEDAKMWASFSGFLGKKTLLTPTGTFLHEWDGSDKAPDITFESNGVLIKLDNGSVSNHLNAIFGGKCNVK